MNLVKWGFRGENETSSQAYIIWFKSETKKLVSLMYYLMFSCFASQGWCKWGQIIQMECLFKFEENPGVQVTARLSQ